MNNITESSSIPSSSSGQEPFNPQIISHKHHRKKRSKLIRVGDIGPAPLNSHGFSKPKPWKKPQFDAPKITRPCSECGKRFWSWKALFGHMRCHPERQWRGINPPPNFQRPLESLPPLGSEFTEEDHEVATCLLMLANGPPNAVENQCGGSTLYVSGQEIVEYLIGETSGVGLEMDGNGSNCRFECSSCKKVFGSHQALGGHRASHKNVKGCFAITRTNNDGGGEVEHLQCCDHLQNDENDAKMEMVLGHQCSICQKVFSSGQALGGHKRCHWEKGEDQPNNQGYPTTSREGGSGGGGLDLNLPAPMETDEDSALSNLGLDLRLGI